MNGSLEAKVLGQRVGLWVGRVWIGWSGGGVEWWASRGVGWCASRGGIRVKR